MGCFMFDIETLGTESNSIVLSAAITFFDFNEKRDQTDADSMRAHYHQYVSSSCFVKFDRSSQRILGRVDTEDTIKWWEKQSPMAKQVSFVPTDSDLSVNEGIAKLRKYIDDHGGNKKIVWARGSLDQVCIDSLCRSVNEEPLFMYNMWRDVRTAIDILAENSKGGYAPIPNFNPDLHVVKHIPQNDCALDILMMLYHV